MDSSKQKQRHRETLRKHIKTFDEIVKMKAEISLLQTCLEREHKQLEEQDKLLGEKPNPEAIQNLQSSLEINHTKNGKKISQLAKSVGKFANIVSKLEKVGALKDEKLREKKLALQEKINALKISKEAINNKYSEVKVFLEKKLAEEQDRRAKKTQRQNANRRKKGKPEIKSENKAAFFVSASPRPAKEYCDIVQTVLNNGPGLFPAAIASASNSAPLRAAISSTMVSIDEIVTNSRRDGKNCVKLGRILVKNP